MRYSTAVQRLGQVAEDVYRASLPGDDPLLTGIYTFGPILQVPDRVDTVDIAVVLDGPVDELSWGAEPPLWTAAIVESLRLSKAPVRWYFRPTVWPVANHRIRQPVPIYSADAGPDRDVLHALSSGQTGQLRLPDPPAAAWREQVFRELDAARAHLHAVQERYWERSWRHQHQCFGICPETHLWNAVWGYLDLYDAAQQLKPPR